MCTFLFTFFNYSHWDVNDTVGVRSFFYILLHIWIVVLLAANLYSHDHTLPDNSHSKIFNIFQDIISVQKDICSLLFFNYRNLVRDICFPSLKTPCQGFLTELFLCFSKKIFFPNFVIILYMKTIKNVLELKVHYSARLSHIFMFWDYQSRCTPETGTNSLPQSNMIFGKSFSFLTSWFPVSKLGITTLPYHISNAVRICLFLTPLGLGHTGLYRHMLAGCVVCVQELCLNQKWS